MKVSDQNLFREAREKTGLSSSALRDAIRKTGIKNFNSRNDFRQVVAYANNQGGSNQGGNNDGGNNQGGDNGLQGEYNDLLKKYEDQRGKIGGYNEEISGYRSKIGNLEGKVRDYDSQIDDYKSRVSTLTDQYSGALKSNQVLTTERDSARQQFADQSAAYQAAMQERDMYREMNVNQQLSSLRGGATAGGANQTSFRSGSLASGRTGYDSGSRDEDLAERVAQEGMTDSVLARETPVVQLIDRRRQGSGQGAGQVRAMTSSGGTGSYYASRFGG